MLPVFTHSTVFSLHLCKHPLCKHNPIPKQPLLYLFPLLLTDPLVEGLRGIVFCVIIPYTNPDKSTLDEAMATFLLDLL